MKRPDPSESHAEEGPSFRWKVVLSGASCVGYAFLGASIAVFGPCLVEFSKLTHSTVGEVSIIYTSRYGGYLASALLLAAPCDRLNRNLALATAFTLAGISITSAPWCPNLITLCVALAINGIATASAQIVANTECMTHWGTGSGAIIQAFNFTFSAFAMLAPLVARPFLGGRGQSGMNDTNVMNLNSTDLNNSSVILYSVNGTLSPYNDAAQNRTIFPCLIVSLPLTLVGLFRFVVFLMDRSETLRQAASRATPQSTSGDKHATKASNALAFVLSVLFFVVGIFAGAVELLWGGFGAAYVTKYHGWSEKSAATVPLVYWLVLTLGRLIGVPVAKCVRPQWIFLFFDIFLTISSVVLVVMGAQNASTVLVCCGLSGLFVAPLGASGVTWTCEVLGVTGLNSSLFLAGTGLGGMFAPLVTARLCETFGSRMFSWTSLGISSSMFVVVCVIILMAKRFRSVQKSNGCEYALTVSALS